MSGVRSHLFRTKQERFRLTARPLERAAKKPWLRRFRVSAEDHEQVLVRWDEDRFAIEALKPEEELTLSSRLI